MAKANGDHGGDRGNVIWTWNEGFHCGDDDGHDPLSATCCANGGGETESENAHVGHEQQSVQEDWPPIPMPNWHLAIAVADMWMCFVGSVLVAIL